MKLLFDQNLSPRLVRRLDGLYAGSSHVSLVGLDSATDSAVWAYAQANNYCIVTKDTDFNDMIVVRGFPPKVIWLRLGNCTTNAVEQVLRAGHAQIVAFENEPTAGLLELI